MASNSKATKGSCFARVLLTERTLLAEVAEDAWLW